MEPLEITGYGHGGVGVGRVDGKVHFVEDALPGDRVRFEVLREKKKWARARATEVVEPGPHRRVAPCPHAGTCGGCDLQSALEESQRAWKREVVGDQLARIGGVEIDVEPVVAASPAFGYRNRMDFSVEDGRPALHRRSSNDLVPLSVCHLLSDPLVDLFDRLGDLTGASGVTIRAGANTGERLVVVDGEVPEEADAWEASVCTVDRGKTTAVIGRPHLHEEVAGVRFRITGSTFFQNSTSGAEALVDLVRQASAGRSGVLIDLYAGGGLFALTASDGFDRVAAVESAAQTARDLAHNVEANRPDVEVVHDRVENVELSPADEVTVVVDPPRTGLGRRGADTVLGADPDRIIYVSCEPASLGRDIGLLGENGFRPSRVTPVDLFPQTHHVEAVVVLDR